MLLATQALSVDFTIASGSWGGARGKIRALAEVSLAIEPGETVGIVGESGSGKSTLARSLMRLTAPTSGQILFEGREITRAEGAELRAYRRSVQMVFQDPYASLDPRFSVGDSVAEPLEIHGIGDRAERARRAAEMLERVGLPSALASRRPHALSGGQRQRVAIARALALRPRLLILDEPCSALDLSVRAQIVNLLLELQRDFGLAYLLIDHDLRLVEHLADRIGVLHKGSLVEIGDTASVCGAPQHPYTRALLSAAVPEKTV